MIKFLTLFKETYKSWDKNDPWAKSAVIAYYALFSLPSLLMITLYVTGLFLGRQAVEGKITAEIGDVIGPDAAKTIASTSLSPLFNFFGNVTILLPKFLFILVT